MPAEAIAAIPLRHACSARRNRSPTVIEPSEPKVSEPPADVSVGPKEMARIKSSTPRTSQMPGSPRCRHSAIDDFPELDPPFKTMTSTLTRREPSA